MRRLQVKICGITRLEDALRAVEAGADMLGYNFYPGSVRHVNPGKCARIHGALQKRGVEVVGVGVFVNEEPGTIQRLLDDCGLELAQLSGDETADDLRSLNGLAFKALRPRSWPEAEGWLLSPPGRADPPQWLVDAHKAGAYGGTGQTGDWHIAAALAARAAILLAGGLTPANVAGAVRQVRPWGVDVASGVEDTPGVKDPAKMRRFVQAARQAQGDLFSPDDPSRQGEERSSQL